VLCELLVMDRENDLDPDPLHGYFANCRSALRRRFITFRATVICSANSGS
jgi:hypothetical protein